MHFFRNTGSAQLHAKPGPIGSTVLGGLISGVGFGILGYCPATMAGAVGQGSLDALFGGIAGMLIGAGIFSEISLKLERSIPNRGYFGDLTWPQLPKKNHWAVVIPVAVGITALLFLIEISGP